MRYLEGDFNISKGQALYYQAWLPDSRFKAVVVLVHGLADHSGRYNNVIDYLVPKGYSVWSYDQRGHGKSPGKRCYIDRFADLTGDLSRFVDFVRQENPSLPLFIIGHSLGALEAAFYSTCHPTWVTGAVLSGLVLKAGESITKRTLKLVKTLSVIIPRLGVRQLECAGISRDENVVKNYIGDPLVFTGKIPARTGAEMLDAMSNVQALSAKIKLPVLLMHGASDRLAEPSGSQLFYNSIASTDKELHFFPGCYHEIFNEPCHDFVLGTMIRWLDKHTLV
ncbi:lysophospholipase [Dehalogenimonas sp. 4OHTPN]|uniref:Monoacylglycerol lipase n=1 Tax=Dehalogenimonas sp. 4OHTPN TaxID=3166643 RepID=A0AAU8G7V8_9CHLR